MGDNTKSLCFSLWPKSGALKNGEICMLFLAQFEEGYTRALLWCVYVHDIQIADLPTVPLLERQFFILKQKKRRDFTMSLFFQKSVCSKV